MLACQRELEGAGSNIVNEVLRGHRSLCDWDHYPDHALSRSAAKRHALRRPDAVIAMADRLRIDRARPQLTNRWVAALPKLFRSQVTDLLHWRDDLIASRRASCREDDVFQDRGLEVPSQIAISIPEQIREIRAVLDKVR